MLKKDGAVSNHRQLLERRRALRKNLTGAEIKLWSLLKGAQLDGRKFRRQHSIGFFILDFYCPAERLAIELDGSPHDSEQAHVRDERRDESLAAQGIKTLHFENKWVFQEAEAVLQEIKNHFGWWQGKDR